MAILLIEPLTILPNLMNYLHEQILTSLIQNVMKYDNIHVKWEFENEISKCKWYEYLFELLEYFDTNQFEMNSITKGGDSGDWRSREVSPWLCQFALIDPGVAVLVEAEDLVKKSRLMFSSCR